MVVGGRELGGFGGVVGTTEAEGGHELDEGREGGHGGRERATRGAGWGQPWTIGPWQGDYNALLPGDQPSKSGCHERAGGDIGDVMEPRRRRA